jgi:hypothetical protein
VIAMETTTLTQNDKIKVIVPDNFQFNFNRSLFEGTNYDIIPIRSYVAGIWNTIKSYDCTFLGVPFCRGDKVVMHTNEVKKSITYTIDYLIVNGYVKLTGDRGDSLLVHKNVFNKTILHQLGDISQDIYDRMRRNAMVGTPEYSYYIRFDEEFHQRACEFNRNLPPSSVTTVAPTIYRDLLPFEDSGYICMLNRGTTSFLCGRIENGKYYFIPKRKRYVLDLQLTEEQVKELIYRYMGSLKVDKLLPQDELV